MMNDQERLLALVKKQSDKNRRLEEHLSNGIGLDKLKKGQTVRDPNYDPLDDLSFDDEQEEMDTGVTDTRRKKKKKAKAGGM